MDLKQLFKGCFKMQSIIIAQTAWQAEPSDRNKEDYIKTINYYCRIGRIDKSLAELLLREVLK